jgi:hypothetical protein
VFTLLVREGGQLTLRETAAPSMPGAELTIDFGVGLLDAVFVPLIEREVATEERIVAAFKAVARFLGSRADAGLAQLYNISSVRSATFVDRHLNGVVPVAVTRDANGAYELTYDALYWTRLYRANKADTGSVSKLALRAAASLFADVIANQVSYADVFLDIERWAARHVAYDASVEGDLIAQVVRQSLAPGDSFVNRALRRELTGTDKRPSEYLPRAPRDDRRPYVYARDEYGEFFPGDFKLQVLRLAVGLGAEVYIARVVQIDNVTDDGLVRASFIKVPGDSLFDLDPAASLEVERGTRVRQSSARGPAPREAVYDYLEMNSIAFRREYNAAIEAARQAF